MDYAFVTPRHLPTAALLPILEGDLSPTHPSMVGHLKCVSPEEVRAALLLAMDRDRRMGRNCMAEWRKVARSMTVTFTKFLGEAEVFAAAANLREDIGAMFDTLYPTTAGGPEGVRSAQKELQPSLLDWSHQHTM